MNIVILGNIISFIGCTIMVAVGLIKSQKAVLAIQCVQFTIQASANLILGAVSGAICGLAGLLLVGGTSHTISTTTVGGRGFTAIMVSWLGKFNPFYMVLTSFLLIFLDQGAQQVSTDFQISSSISDIVIGIILLFIIGCEFFLQYRVVTRKQGKGDAS